MIAHDQKCIFVHTRKAAGSSIKALFPGPTPGLNNGILDEKWDETDPMIINYFKFTVVRNPWDRFVSGWRYCASTHDLTLHEVLENLPQLDLRANILAEHTTPRVRSNFLEAYTNEQISKKAHEVRVRAMLEVKRKPRKVGHDYRHLTRQQTATFIYPDRRLAIDDVLYMEDLANGLANIAERIGINIAQLEHKNKSRKIHDEDYRSLFDDRARVLFEKAYEDDIALLGYDFDAGPGVAPSNLILAPS